MSVEETITITILTPPDTNQCARLLREHTELARSWGREDLEQSMPGFVSETVVLLL